MIDEAKPGEVQVTRALLSVSDKTGLIELARGLHELGIELVSTGGTARALRDAGIPARPIEEFTGFPEMMDGRVKTLHPKLYAGLLARRDNDSQVQAANEHEIEPVDLVCVNLYPFEQTLARGDASDAEIIENIDIGGPTMIRAAAKNSAFAAVVVDPADYGLVLTELRRSADRVVEGEGMDSESVVSTRDEGDATAAPARLISMETRGLLAAKAFALTARYDAAISTWFAQRVYGGPPTHGFPPTWRDAYEKVMDVRYGENPHQQGAFYRRVGSPTHLLEGVTQLHGKELSFNNLLDLSSARELVEEIGVAGTGGVSTPACAIVKHNNPCGCALGETLQQAYEKAFACDPMSAYGGVIAVNKPVDRECAQKLSEQFIEVLLAPAFDPAALEVLQAKKNVRLLELPKWPEPAHEVESKPVIGGQLVQTRDVVSETRADMRVMSGAGEPSAQQWDDLEFAWRVCRHVRSNAIVIASDRATIGIGAGQTSRVDAVKLAVEKAREFRPDRLAGSALASDAYFPFADGPQVAIEAGVGAIIQPGGSVRDEEVVAAVDAAGVVMVATDVRHFRH
jgi:phosphoribosylaminoimidazolecarboxamide formyltransferase / IMP cyclohydrolase